MATYFVLQADFAFKTADVMGVHSFKRKADGHCAALSPAPDGSRPIVVTATEYDKMARNGWDIGA